MKRLMFVVGVVLMTACTDSSPRPYTLIEPLAQTGPAHILLGQPIDINAATESDFEALPGIGPALAKRIVMDRSQRGAFSSPADLMRVNGIGNTKFSNIASYIMVTSK